MAVFPYFLTSFVISAKPSHSSHSLMLCKAVPETAFPSSGKWTDISIVSNGPSVNPTDVMNSIKLLALVGLYLWPQSKIHCFSAELHSFQDGLVFIVLYALPPYLAGRGNERSETFVWINPRCFTCWNVLHRNMHYYTFCGQLLRKKCIPNQGNSSSSLTSH